MKALIWALSLTALIITGSDAQKTLQERHVHDTYTEEITFLNKRRQVAIVQTFTLSGERITEERYTNYGAGIKHGLTRCWYPNGQTYWSADFKRGEMHGPLLVFHPDGTPKRREYFKNGYSVKSECFSAMGESQSCGPFAQPASYVGTDKEFLTQLKQRLQEAGYIPNNSIRQVWMLGMVLDNGQLSNPVVYPTDFDSASQLRLALMQIPRWQPASVDGEPVTARYAIYLLLVGREVHLDLNRLSKSMFLIR